MAAQFAPRLGRDFIARHGETVFNAAHRLQGDAPHTPLTRAGFAQAEEMGRALRDQLGARPKLTLWASNTGRACRRWRSSPSISISTGMMRGYYADVVGEVGPVIDAQGLLRPAPDGEDYPAIAARVSGWLADTDSDAGDRLVIMHGISSRVMRGVMTGAAPGAYGAPVLPGHPQGTVTMIAGGHEAVVHLGAGYAPA